MKPLVVVPTYQERENLPVLIADVLASPVLVDILVVDDASPDGTGHLADALAAAHPHVHVLHRIRKEGLGVAYQAGFAWGITHGYDALVEMDADGSHHAEDLPSLLEGLKDADLVLGSRWVAGGRTQGWSARREAMSRIGNAYTRALLGLEPLDVSSGFRAYRVSALEKLEKGGVVSLGYCFQVEMVMRAVRAGLSIGEVPITFSERRHGHSKMDSAVMWESFRRVTLWGAARLTQRGATSGAAGPVSVPAGGIG